METSPPRGQWVTSDPLYQTYHDQEWGSPTYDSAQLFEMLCLEGAQAGLAWITVLKKREHYRLVFDGFDPLMIARYDQKKITALLLDPGIIRHRGKVEAFIANAKAYQRMAEQGEDFSAFIWSFVDGKPIVNHWTAEQAVPSYTELSIQMSHALKQRGFMFVGKTICYAFMQAAGLVNDHEACCFKKKEAAQPIDSF